MTAKRDVSRPYRPEFVSIETLAYMLDCSETKIRQMVRDGQIPQALPPNTLGGLVRWRWVEIETKLSATKDETSPFQRALTEKVA